MEFTEIPFFDDDVYKLAVRFAFNVFFLTLVTIFAIYPSQREREFAFTAVMMNITVFFICFTMKKLELDIGLALGLFAIFGVLRYRTDAIRAKEMTYLFIVIGIAVINALSNKKTSYVELISVNTIIFTVAMLKERLVKEKLAKPSASMPTQSKAAMSKTPTSEAIGDQSSAPKPIKLKKHSLDYDKLEHLSPADRPLLLNELRERTGIPIEKVQVQNIDLRSGSAQLTIWYLDSNGTSPRATTGSGDDDSDPID